MTTITIEFDADVFESVVAEKTFQVPFADCPADSLAKIFVYGAQRIINDKCGGADKTDEEKWTIAEAVITRIKDGTIATRQRRAGGEAEPEINRFIRAAVRKTMNRKGDNWKQYTAIDSTDQAARADFLWSVYEAADAETRDVLLQSAETALANHHDDLARAARLSKNVSL